MLFDCIMTLDLEYWIAQHWNNLKYTLQWLILLIHMLLAWFFSINIFTWQNAFALVTFQLTWSYTQVQYRLAFAYENMLFPMLLEEWETLLFEIIEPVIMFFKKDTQGLKIDQHIISCVCPWITYLATLTL